MILTMNDIPESQISDSKKKAAVTEQKSEDNDVTSHPAACTDNSVSQQNSDTDASCSGEAKHGEVMPNSPNMDQCMFEESNPRKDSGIAEDKEEPIDKADNVSSDEGRGSQASSSGNINDASNGESGSSTAKEDMSSMLAEIQSLSQQFQERLSYDATKEELITVLHRENQKFRNGLLEQAQRPLVLEVAKIWSIASDVAIKRVEEHDDVAAEDLKFIVLLLEEAMNIAGASPFECEVGAPFDARWQQIMETIPTEDKTKSRTVASSCAQGVSINGKPLVRQKVRVYKLTTKPQAESSISSH